VSSPSKPAGDKNQPAPIPFYHRVFHAVVNSTLGINLLAITRLLYPHGRRDWVDITHLHLQLPRLDPDFDGYRLVQISDFHFGTWLDRHHLREAIDLVNQQRPDLVAVTGDFVTYQPERFEDELVAELACIRPRDATLAVLGNHDYWTKAEVVERILERSGIINLANKVHVVRRDSAQLVFAGVDDVQDGMDRLDLVIPQIPTGSGAVLLVHQPDFADISAATGCFDLQISGHTHGGQIIFPRLGALLLPNMGRKYLSGLYRVQDMLVYTNRGLGTSEIQWRYHCRPEITVYHLHSV
jgi:predicted MPP superfamily phosphohydrolase